MVTVEPDNVVLQMPEIQAVYLKTIPFYITLWVLSHAVTLLATMKHCD